MEQGDSREIAAPEVPQQDRPRLALSATQLVASVLAAVTAAVLASYLGVNGTVIGAAVVSLLSALGTAIFGHSIERTGQRVRTVVPASARWMPAREIAAAPMAVARPASPARSQSRLGQIGITAAAVFAAALALLTTVELFAGRPISDLIKGQSASGTTVFGSQVKNSTPVPTVTVTVVPKVVVSTPTITQTAPPVTVTPTPTVTVTPAPSATPTPSSTTTTP